VKKAFSIFLLALICSIPCGNAAEKIAPADTIQVEAIALDSTTYRELKAQKKFNYYDQRPEESNALQKLREAIFRWLLKHNPEMTSKQFNVLLIAALIVVLILVVLFLYFYKPSLFYINRKQKLNYRLDEEDLEGTNFDRLIQQALGAGDYTEAIRWCYLKVLKRLNERELISFDSHKTVNEYVHEPSRTDLKSGFRMLSRQFIYYRYGNGNATREIFEQFQELNDDIQKRLAISDKS
jgi:hypothetical protein